MSTGRNAYQDAKERDEFMESFEVTREGLESRDLQVDFIDPQGRIEKGGENTMERVKSSLRLQYEAQVRVIRGQIGDLEKVRTNLGLSQRKIAQLLLVDPSAWTRWTRAREEAPPHVWRALQWYLSLQEKNPALSPSTFLFAGARFPQENSLRKLESDSRLQEERVQQLETRIAELKAAHVTTAEHRDALERIESLRAETKKLRGWLLFWMCGSLALGVLCLFALKSA